MLSVVVLSHVVNDGVHRECFAFDFDSKIFLFFRTVFYFLLFFSKLLFTIFLFFYLCFYSLCLLEPAINYICHHLLEGFFFLPVLWYQYL